jgi:hypothetical protein
MLRGWAIHTGLLSFQINIGSLLDGNRERHARVRPVARTQSNCGDRGVADHMTRGLRAIRP